MGRARLARLVLTLSMRRGCGKPPNEERKAMKLVTAIIKPFKLDEVR